MRDPRDIIEDMRNEELNKTRIALAKYKDACATQLKSLAKANRKEEQQAARVKELEEQLKNVIEEKNNRRNQHQLELSAIKDYFKQQNEALKAENEALLNAINNHNEACISDCSARSDTDLCKAYTNRGRYCTECPKDYLIQLANEGEG